MANSEDRDSGASTGVAVLDELSRLPAPARIEAMMDASRKMLAQATTDFARLREHAHWGAIHRAARVFSRQDVLVQAAEMVFTAEHAIFLADRRAPPAKGGRGNKSERDIDPDLLRNIRNAFRYVDTRLFRGLVERAREAGEPLTRKAIRQAGLEARRSASPDTRRPKVVHYTGDAGWITPPYILEAARRTMGGIDLDPASNEKAQEFVQAERYYTEHEDGLKRAWSGRVWCNPPYTRGLLEAFVDRLLKHLEAGKVTQAVLLTNNSTDTVWFHRALGQARAVCLLAGRVRYHEPDGAPSKNSPIQGQAILYFSREADGLHRFVAEFGRHGRVCTPVFPEPE